MAFQLDYCHITLTATEATTTTQFKLPNIFEKSIRLPLYSAGNHLIEVNSQF